MIIRVQEADFDAGAELAALAAGREDAGAVASFIGRVRGGDVAEMTLEHYPGMTEAALSSVAGRAMARFGLIDALIIHRIGPLAPGEQIVLAAAASRHRQAAFDGAAFMMDYLKTEAPFWKKESTPEGERWVDARESDDHARERWEQG